jgi:putative heme-binding domain-containing protein
MSNFIDTIYKVLKSMKRPIIYLLGVALVFGFGFTQDRIKKSGTNASKASKLKLAEGFKAEHLHSPSEAGQGSWVAMCFDDKKRLICSDQYGSLYRLNLPEIGSEGSSKIEKLKIGPAADTLGMGFAQGLLYAHNSLYVMINNSRSQKEFTLKSGLYRLQDLDGDDQYETIKVLKEMVGYGEHGPHSIVPAPDNKSLYVICGNYTDAPSMDSYTVNPRWDQDNLFPLIKDPRGHANDRHAPGGWVAQIDPEGKNWNMVSMGYRNAFDMAFNAAGDLFVYDADMEWDFGTPWYRPTRICHATSGSEMGWRTGNSKWHPSWPDNLPPVLNIGQGSPTNLVSLQNARFPAKYRNSLLAFDWSFGIMHQVQLRPLGSSYVADREEFLSGLPLPLTDGVVGPDGALYFLTGGRKLESDLYRVYFTGQLDKYKPEKPNALNLQRRSLEQYHKKLYEPSKAIEEAWAMLKHPDRHIKYAARLVLEHQDPKHWANKLKNEKDTETKILGSIALSRSNDKNYGPTIRAALAEIQEVQGLNKQLKIDYLRAIELSMNRKMITEADKASFLNTIENLYPSGDALLDRSLSKVLLHLGSNKLVTKTLPLLSSKTELKEDWSTATSDLIFRNPQYGLDLANLLSKIPPAQQTYMAVVLSEANKGWTEASRKRYFEWYRLAFSFKGGNSYIGFIDKSRKMALDRVPADKRKYYDQLSGADLLSNNGLQLATVNYPKGPGKYWSVGSALPYMDSLSNRSFENGRDMYLSAACMSCHSMGGEGSVIGPELSQLGSRFTPKDMLEAIIEPNKTISDQYAATVFILKNGSSVVGKLVNQDAGYYYVSQNPFVPKELNKVPKNQVLEKRASDVSIMYSGLINSMNKNELRDLIAYLMAGGNKEHELYRK